jgi:hypothetical protein
LSAAQQHEDNLYSLVLHLSNKSASNNDKLPIKFEKSQNSSEQNLLVQLYFAYPNLVGSLSSEFTAISSAFPISLSKQTSQVILLYPLIYQLTLLKLDFLLHTVVKRLLDPNTSNSAYLIIRKLSISHPLLILR